MEKIDKQREQAINNIVKRAEKEISKLSEAQKTLIAGHVLGLTEQIKALADKMDVHRDTLLLAYAGMIHNTALSESDIKPAKTYEPFKSDYIQ